MVPTSSCQELDKHWRIMTETSIKAKSVKGYATYNRKLTENKWKPGCAKPELVEDWDQRLLVTTLARNQEGRALELSQVAEKDQVLAIIKNLTIVLKWKHFNFCFRNFVLTV